MASDPTLWRTLDGVDAHARDRLAAARAKTRRHVRDQVVARHGAVPASVVADRDLGETVVIRLDATHTRHIFTKLDVDTRRVTVTRAGELDLL